jgi:SAM-dependent methyltransferase
VAAVGGAEFDRYADSYAGLHGRSIRLSGEEPSYFADYKVRVLARLTAGETIRSIVDFGAGVGASVPFFRRYFPAAELTCLDVSADSLARARACHGADAANFVAYGGYRLPLADGCTDLAFAACVFHHIPQGRHAAALAELRRILKPGGQLVVFEHNPLNPLTAHAVNNCPFDENAILIPAHRMRERMAEAGFRELERDFCVFFPAFLSRLRPLERHLGWLPLGAQYLVRGRR